MNKKGFTLVEIMIVVAIIGLLAAIAIPSFMRARTTSQMNACINNLRQIEAGKDQYSLDKGLTNGAFCTANAAGVNEDEIAFSNLVGGADGYIKQWPLCPASTTEPGVVAIMAGLCAFDYDVNCVGSNAICSRQGDGISKGGADAVTNFQHRLPISQ